MLGRGFMEVLILGMHRSGTSLVSAIINKLGIFGGDEETLERSAEWNPKGYWEFRQFTQANNRILAALGARWDRVSALDESLIGLHEAGISGICMELEPSFKRFDGHGDWAIKDPRLCLLLPAWRRHFRNPLAVLVVRDPVEVAISLSKRNQMPLSVGIALWEFYMRSAVRYAQGMPIVVVDYNALLQNPKLEIAALQEKLASRGLRVSGVTEELLGFVDSSLYRSRKLNVESEALLNLKQSGFYEALRQGDVESAGTAISAGGIEVLELYEKAFPEMPAWKKKWRHFTERFSRSNQ
jgi:hypothetical protein